MKSFLKVTFPQHEEVTALPPITGGDTIRLRLGKESALRLANGEPLEIAFEEARTHIPMEQVLAHLMAHMDGEAEGCGECDACKAARVTVGTATDDAAHRAFGVGTPGFAGGVSSSTPDDTHPSVLGMTVPGYESLASVLHMAYDQAASGKGKERHAIDLPFDQQPMQMASRLAGSHDGLIYQAIKKASESQRMPHDRAVKELLGAINYLAGAIIYRENSITPNA